MENINDVTIPKFSNWVFPVYGFINYVNNNVKAKTTDTNSYATGFYHLLGMHITEVGGIVILSYKGLEALLK